MKKIEVGKSYKTRKGRQVRIYAVDGAGDTAIHGAVWSDLGTWRSTSWYADGSYLECVSHDWDIVIPPLKYEGVARIYYFEGGNPKIYVPIEFAGFAVKFTLEVLDEKSFERLPSEN